MSGLFSPCLSVAASEWTAAAPVLYAGAVDPSGGSMAPPPAGTPPPSGGDGSGDDPFRDLMRSFSDEARRVSSPRLSASLLTLVDAHAALRSRSRNVDGLVRQTAASLATFATSDMEACPPDEWRTVASALHAAGVLILARGERSDVGALVSEIFLASSLLENRVNGRRSRPGAATAENLFFHDRSLADTILSLKGWWNPGTFEPEVMEPLGAVLARAGTASGAVTWPRTGFDFPNLSGALYAFFGNREPSALRHTSLLTPSAYFRSAASWRPDSWGYQEAMIAGVLDGDRLDRTLAYGEAALGVYAADEGLESLMGVLRTPARRDASLVRTLVEAAVRPADLPERQGGLIDFLGMALEVVH